jgi:Zn-dependent protease
MTETIRLGTVAGVRVGLHWSVLGIVVLLLVFFAGGLPAQFPDHSPAAYILAALVATALFVLSLLAHEIGHAVVAVRNGIEVDGITLWLLGGVARLRGEATNPGMDFRIAAVGPAISLVVGAAFTVASWVLSGTQAPELVTGVVSYLGAINILLAAFNLIPAAPLDGGRILRAALWAWRGDQAQAQIWSARAGRVFGFLLVALGVFGVFAGTGGGLWWVLIGLFIITMASVEENYARTSAILGGLRARDIMTPNPDTADPGHTVNDFVRNILMTRRHSAFPLVLSNGEVAGIVTLNRIRALPPDRHASTTIGQIACPTNEVPIARPDELVSELLVRLGGCVDGRALVMDGDRLVGIISPTDISRAATVRGIGVQSFDGADLARSTGPWR